MSGVPAPSIPLLHHIVHSAEKPDVEQGTPSALWDATYLPVTLRLSAVANLGD